MSVRIYGNREIITLPGLDMRPTPAKVRQALFNIWQGEINNCRWLDLCSGSGAMGAEAICRGASLVIGIESSRPAGDIIRQNWAKVSNNSGAKWQLINGDVRSSLARLAGQTFDRIYFDPPYGDGLYIPVLTEIDRLNLLAADGEIAFEHSPYTRISQLPDPAEISFEIARSRTYGKTALTFYRRQTAVIATNRSSEEIPHQPLRIPDGWNVTYNNALYAADPNPELYPEADRWWLFKEDMLQIYHDRFDRLLDVGWYPEGDLVNGCYGLVIYAGDFSGQLLYELRTRDRQELVTAIEEMTALISEGKFSS